MNSRILCRGLNGLCRTLYSGELKRFTSPCDVGSIQNDHLITILDRNAYTEYGRKDGFSRIRSYREFAENVPLTAYEDYEEHIQRIADGENNVLTAEAVKLLEPTSGSSGGRKLIPYTASLQREFQRGIRPWIGDIYSHVPGVMSGSSYWSVTPVTSGKQFTPSGIPIGFEEDSAYFGRLEKHIMDRIFAVDSSVKFSGSMESFWYNTAVQLLNCPCLSLVSVWNPTYLSILCRYISDNALSLAKGIPAGKRYTFLRYALSGRFNLVFPELRIISCWADGCAADSVGEVQSLFPGVYIQPKGIIATECFTSFPLVGESGSRLSIFSHFFEFRSIKDGSVVTACGLVPGEYEIIVTTGGGLYRYCIGDIIQVIEVFPDAPPLVRFLRRAGAACDLFGEKLTEDFVRNVLSKLCIADKFCLLAPEGNRYCLYTEDVNISGEQLDAALCESFHYSYCRQLGQLGCAVVVHASPDAKIQYLKRLTDDGMRLGDIKPSCLSRKSGWGKYLTLERNT